MQIARGFFPRVIVDQIIPVGDLVINRAARVAIGNAAIHAARRLAFRGAVTQRDHKFIIVANTISRWRIFAILAVDFEKACDFTHDRILSVLSYCPLVNFWLMASNEKQFAERFFAMKFTTRLEKDGDALVLPLHVGVVESMGIEEGDEILLESIKSGVAILRLVKNKMAESEEQSSIL